MQNNMPRYKNWNNRKRKGNKQSSSLGVAAGQAASNHQTPTTPPNNEIKKAPTTTTKHPEPPDGHLWDYMLPEYERKRPKGNKLLIRKGAKKPDVVSSHQIVSTMEVCDDPSQPVICPVEMVEDEKTSVKKARLPVENEAVKALIGLSAPVGEKVKAKDTPAPAKKKGANRLFEEQVRIYEKEGRVTTSTRPIVHVGRMRKKKDFDPISEGKNFHQVLKEKIQKKKYFEHYTDNKTKGDNNKLQEFRYASLLFYNPNALKVLYPGEEIKALEVLQDGKQSCDLGKFLTFQDNKFLIKLREELIMAIPKKAYQFYGILDAENVERKDNQNENIPEAKGELGRHLCYLFIFYFTHN